MTRDETKVIFATLKTAFPAFYSKCGAEEITAAIDLWAVMFADYDSGIVQYALYEILREPLDFPPTIGRINQKIRDLMQAATNEATDEELWQILVDTASRYGIYEAQKGFDSLPPVLKRYCGGPSHIRDLAVIDVETLNTVTHSTFLRSIKHIKEREEASAAMPEGVRAMLASVYKPIAQSPALTEAEVNERRNWVLDQLDSGITHTGGNV